MPFTTDLSKAVRGIEKSYNFVYTWKKKLDREIGVYERVIEMDWIKNMKKIG